MYVREIHTNPNCKKNPHPVTFLLVFTFLVGNDSKVNEIYLLNCHVVVATLHLNASHSVVCGICIFSRTKQ